jgi:hypothetical protein
MHVIIQTSKDLYSTTGVNYFASRYGFSPDMLEQKIHLKRRESDTAPDTGKKITGWIMWKGVRLPAISTPPPLSDQGIPLLLLKTDKAEYSCAIATDSDIIISLDIFWHLGFFLSGGMEETWSLLKEGKKEHILVPFSDYYCDFLFSCLQMIHNKQNIPLVYQSLWPEGKSFAVHLSHDVDEVKKSYQWMTHPWKYMKNRDFNGLYHQYLSLTQKIRKKIEPYWTFESLMQMEDELGVKSSFYFLKETSDVRITDRKTWRHMGRRYDWNSDEVRSVMKKMHENGWEVGLHGSFNSYLDHNKICREKKALETAFDAGPIVGVRQHNLNLKIPLTWIGHEKCGLLYDATLGYNDSIGFRWGTCLPFHPYLPEEERMLNLLEIPLIIEDLPFFENTNRREDTLKIIDAVINQQGMLSLLWHHTVFNDHEYPGWSKPYKQIIEYCKKRNAWMTTGKNITEWWLQREASEFSWDFNDRILSINPQNRNVPYYFTVCCPTNLMLKSIKNAEVIHSYHDLLVIRAVNIKPDERIEIEYTITGK